MRSSLKHNTFSEQWLEVGPLWTEFTTGKLLRTHELNTSWKLVSVYNRDSVSAMHFATTTLGLLFTEWASYGMVVMQREQNMENLLKRREFWGCV